MVTKTEKRELLNWLKDRAVKAAIGALYRNDLLTEKTFWTEILDLNLGEDVEKLMSLWSWNEIHSELKAVLEPKPSVEWPLSLTVYAHGDQYGDPEVEEWLDSNSIDRNSELANNIKNLPYEIELTYKITSDGDITLTHADGRKLMDQNSNMD